MDGSSNQVSRVVLWDTFLKRWPRNVVVDLTLDQYVLPSGNKDSFCYWLEQETERLGSIKGGSSYKFGVYQFSSGSKTPRSDDKKYASDGTYGWRKPFGQSADDVFRKVKQAILDIIDAAATGDYERISQMDTPFFPVVKWKLSFLYQPDDRPSFLPIYKDEILRQLSGMAKGATMPAMQRKLIQNQFLSQHISKTNLMEYYQELLQTRADCFKRKIAESVDPEHSSLVDDDSGVNAHPKEDVVNPSTDYRGQFVEWIQKQPKRNAKSKNETISTKAARDYADALESLARSYSTKILGVTDISEFERIYREITTAEDFENKNKNRLHSQAFDWYESFLLSKLPRQRIYFGAPGTGKSYQLKVDVEGGENKKGNATKGFFVNGSDIRYERVTFYPTYSYAQFVGCYKPAMKGKDIAYEFVPGPFLRVLVNSLRDLNDHCIVIEEINRANAAAVFGDVFQLLDRATKDSGSGDDLVRKGESEYDVAASEDVRLYLKTQLDRNSFATSFLKVKKNNKGDWTECRLRIPSNMYIWATMNSADQGVFPMDTAFKRRWEFEYIPIDAGEDAAPAGKKKPTEWTIDGVTDSKGNAYNWNEVRKFVNSLLSLHGVNEDKLMGAHFVQAPDGVVSAKAFESKVLMYLWEDAGRMCRKDLFDDIATYSNLLTDWHGTDKVKAKGIKVFDRDKKREDLESELKDWYKNVTEAPSAD